MYFYMIKIRLDTYHEVLNTKHTILSVEIRGGELSIALSILSIANIIKIIVDSLLQLSIFSIVLKKKNLKIIERKSGL